MISALIATSICTCAQSKERVSILGDSYSTFEGYIPEGNEPWYFQKIDTSRSDMVSVRLTWWWRLIKESGYLLEKNNTLTSAVPTSTHTVPRLQNC